MRIFGWVADPGTAYWRLRVPLGELSRRGHDVMVDGKMPAAVIRDHRADVIVGSRTANDGASATFRRLAQDALSLVVYEMDDDVWTIDPANKPAMDYFTAERLRVIETNLANAHLVTVSTRPLAERARQFTDAPISVLANRVPRWLTELPAPWERAAGGPVTVSHTGGPSHYRDFGECAKPLRAWLQRHGDRTEFASYGLDSSGRVATIRGHARHVSWQDSVEGYLRSLVGTDIGIAPLRGTEFDRSKSALKAMEWGAIGCPVIASNVEPYVSYVRHGVTGFLCSTPREWRDALDALLDPDLRHQMGLAGRLQACEHLIEDHAGTWLDAYDIVGTA